MDKQTQLYVGIGALAVIGFIILNKKRPVIVVNYSGTTTTDVVGRVQRADGIKKSPKTIYAPKVERLQVTTGIFSADGKRNCDPVLDKNCSKKAYKPEKSFFDIKDSKFGW